jgi:hypothetical protein
MEKSNKRGKIPQSDWPQIMARYEAGETLASIARTYDCSPPAISYVVSRSRTRQPAPERIPMPAAEPQLIKSVVGDEGGIPAPPAEAASRPAAAANGDPRRTLHLSLGQPHGNGGARPGEPPAAERPHAAPHIEAPADPSDHRNGAAAPAGNGARPHDEPRHHNGGAAPRREGGAFIDRELRARVEGDIAAFLAAFDAALDEDTMESRAALREAADRLLRAGARTRIELERLEARLPLPARDGAGRSNPAWRER